MDVRYVANLARIELTEDEAERYEKQLDQVLGYVEQLRSVDVEGIEPTAHANPVFDVTREDEAHDRSFSAEEALAFGFVTRVVEDPLALAMETAAEIAARNPDAQRANKRLLNAAHQLTPAEGLLMESEEQDKIIGTPNQVEAVMAELEKRPANFRD